MSAKSVIIIGAGSAGLTAAGYCAGQGHRVSVLEKNDRPARKLMITGKGRCNLTNDCSLQRLISSVPRNGKFLYGAFSKFSPRDTMALFESCGVALKTERGNRVFPVSDRAVDVVDALVSFARLSGAEIAKRSADGLLIKDSRICGVIADGKELPADAVIIATGGKSYPLTGSTGDGYRLAQSAGHTIIEPQPSLVPLNIHENFCYDLQGLSLRNAALKVVLRESGKEIYCDFGEMLFTHFGVSGPMILSASAHMRDMTAGKYKLLIDLKPALSGEQLDKRVLRDFEQFQNRDFINVLPELLPRKLIPVVVRLSGIGAYTKVNAITRTQRLALVKLIKEFRLTVTGFRPIEEAIVTSGGVKVSEIDPKTMQSKLVKGLYFAGEVIDVDGYTGGFNLQIAFSTGYLAGSSI